MELILLGIYSYIIYLVFFKFKWLPWNFVTQVITITIPIVGLTLLILLLNIVAPSSADVRVVNYVVAVNARVQGMVVDVPITPNQAIKRGQVLFRLDPRPVEIEIQGFKAQIEALQAQLLTAGANTKGFGTIADQCPGQPQRHCRAAPACQGARESDARAGSHRRGQPVRLPAGPDQRVEPAGTTRRRPSPTSVRPKPSSGP